MSWGNDPLQDDPAPVQQADPSAQATSAGGQAAPLVLEVHTKRPASTGGWGNDPLEDDPGSTQSAAAIPPTPPPPRKPSTNFLGFEAPLQGWGEPAPIIEQMQKQPVASASGLAGAATRGLAPIAAGAGVGAMLAAPLAGIGAIPGAALGATAAGLVQLGATVYNPLADIMGLPRMTTPQEMTDKALDAIGVAKPQTPLERTVEAGAGAASGAVGTAVGASQIANMVTSPTARYVAEAMGANPGQQAAAGWSSGVVAQGAQEVGAQHPVIASLIGTPLSMVVGTHTYLPEAAEDAAARAARANSNEQNAAIDRAEQRLRDDVQGSPMTAQEVLDDFNRAKERNIPQVIADVGPNTQGELGKVSRAPGASKSIARANLEGRDDAAGARITQAIEQDMATGPSVWRAAQALTDQRTADSVPLYNAAMAGGSIAPLRDQLADRYTETVNQLAIRQREADAAASALRAARADQPPTSNIYEPTPANRVLMQAVARNERAQADLVQAIQDRDATLDILNRARNDRDMDRPGAVWSPTIDRLMRNPIMQRGMAKGRLRERVVADTEGRPYHFTDVDFDEYGNLINVPTMRILAAGKEGLDAIIEQEGRADFGRLNSWGREVWNFQKALLDEMDRINPTYAHARQMYAGYSASRDAIRWGEGIANRTDPEQIAHEFAEMTESQREFARLGAAQTLRMKVLQAGDNGDEAKRILFNEWQRMQYRPLFRSQEDMEHMIYALEKERQMFETNTRVLRNSMTAEREVEDMTSRSLKVGGRLARAASMASNKLRAANEVIQALRGMRAGGDENVNAQLAHILSDLGADLYMKPDGELGVRPAGGFPALLPPSPGAAGALAGLQGKMATQPAPQGQWLP